MAAPVPRISRWRNAEFTFWVSRTLDALRKPERLALVYFFYLAGLTLLFRDRPHADSRVMVLALALACFIFLLAWCEKHWSPLTFSMVRDWTTLVLVLVAYRSLDWFSPEHYRLVLEQSWLQFDVTLLERWRVREAIERWGAFLPGYLEICYLLTSGAGCYAIAILYLYRKRERCDCFLLIYLAGTLLSYAAIPLFPSQPPRIAFPSVAIPHVYTVIRTLNLKLLSGAGIHSGVFPSAHVSSTFAAAWGMFRCLPERRIFGWLFLVYAISVAIATVYGRYHYAVDAIAGIGVSIAAFALAGGSSRFFAKPNRWR
jgi:membrane-associated phospholipid phosphatase